MNKIWKASLLAPLAGPPVVTVGMTIFAVNTPSSVEVLYFLLVTYLFSSPIFYAGFLFLGIPAHKLLTKYNFTRMWNYAFAGYVVGATTYFIFMLSGRTLNLALDNNYLFSSPLVIGGFSGLCIAIVFFQLAGITSYSSTQ